MDPKRADLKCLAYSYKVANFGNGSRQRSKDDVRNRTMLTSRQREIQIRQN